MYHAVAIIRIVRWNEHDSFLFSSFTSVPLQDIGTLSDTTLGALLLSEYMHIFIFRLQPLKILLLTAFILHLSHIHITCAHTYVLVHARACL